MIPLKKNSNSHTAKYLVLLADEYTTRALLFGQDQRYLGELIDDGLLLDDLMKTCTACVPPSDVARHAWATDPGSVRCFALDVRRENG